MISLLVAADTNNLIGKDNGLPWHLPADLKYFKNLTWGMPILMGRKTFESIGKPLPGRTNMVITRNKGWQHEGAIAVHTLEEAIALAKTENVKELFIIGGAEIFTAGTAIADRIYLTRIHHTFDGDVYFPTINKDEWQLVKEVEGRKDEKNPYDYTFQTWDRKRK